MPFGRALQLVMGLLLILCRVTPRAQAQTPKPECPKSDATRASTECHTLEKEKIEPRKEVVVVSGTFAPISLDSLDRSITVITRGDSLLYDHWTDYLRADSSIDLRQRAPNAVQGDLSIRGSTFGQTLVLLNGLRLNDVQSAHHNVDQPIPTDALQQIEVIRGAGSAFYGSDAVGGLVNFVTGPADASEIKVGSAIGTFGVNQQNASLAYVRRSWNEQLSFERDFSSGFRPDRDYRSVSILSNSGLQTALGNTQVMLGSSDKAFGADQFYGDFNSWERTKGWFAGIKQNLGEDTQFDLGYRRHTDIFILFRDNPGFFLNDHVSESWQTAIRRKRSLRNSMWFYGAEGFHDSVDSTNLGEHARSRAAIYLNYNLQAHKHYSLSAAAREEVFGAGQAEFSPTISAGVTIKTGWKLKASASRAFRLPTYTDLYYHDPGNVGNPGLRPEHSWGYEGGFELDTRGRYKADVTVFHRRDRDVIDYLKSSTIYVAANIQRLNFTGVETSVDARLRHQQRIVFSYTGLYGAQQPLQGQQTKYTFNYPVHDAVISWRGTLPKKFNARCRAGVVSRYQRDPYALFDLFIGREFRNAGAHLSLANISNTQYEEIDGVVMPGRSLLFGLEFRLKRRRP